MSDYFGDFGVGRLLIQRGLGGIYLLAFLCAARQFRPLLGERGLLPVPHYLERVRFSDAPSIFHFHRFEPTFETANDERQLQPATSRR
ncbi:MAG TPA: hypothetical protein VEX18_08460 [Polyangiaceae bacterium]|nr:hypothetical protein [Polyangiaceae bacterium]